MKEFKSRLKGNLEKSFIIIQKKNPKVAKGKSQRAAWRRRKREKRRKRDILAWPGWAASLVKAGGLGEGKGPVS